MRGYAVWMGVAAWLVAAPRAADACGGLFCNGAQPVVQDGERILFVLGEGEVDVLINIRYEGDAADFGWILPLQAEPVEVRVAPGLIFNALDAFAPQFWTNVETEGSCTDRVIGFGALGAEDAGAAFGAGGGVQIRSEDRVGPYQTVVLDADDADDAIAWLEDNGYAVPPGSRALIGSYLAADNVLMALKLANEVGVDQIQPIWVRMEGAEACVPIKLTALAANPDMDVIVSVLTRAGRAIPTNYTHVTPNLARLDWVNVAANYDALVGEALDEGGGRAFVTEYAGPTRDPDTFADLQTMLRPFPVGSLSGLRTPSTQPADEFVASLGFLARLPEARAIVRSMIPETAFFKACGNCALQVDDTLIEVEPIIDALEAQIMEPLVDLLAAVEEYPSLTRLRTRLSPEEMTLDPIFEVRTGLPDIPVVRRATVIRECGFGGSSRGAISRVRIEGLGEITLDGSSVPDAVQSLPAALRVENLADGAVLQDNEDRIRSGLDEVGSSCRALGTDGAVTWLLAIVLLGSTLRRRRPS